MFAQPCWNFMFSAHNKARVETIIRNSSNGPIPLLVLHTFVFWLSISGQRLGPILVLYFWFLCIHQFQSAEEGRAPPGQVQGCPWQVIMFSFLVNLNCLSIFIKCLSNINIYREAYLDQRLHLPLTLVWLQQYLAAYRPSRHLRVKYLYLYLYSYSYLYLYYLITWEQQLYLGKNLKKWKMRKT